MKPSFDSRGVTAGAGICRAAAAVIRAAVLVGSGALALAIAGAAERSGPKVGPKFDPEVARKFAGVMEWRGFFETTERAQGASSSPSGNTQYAYEGASHGQFILSRDTKTGGWSPEDGTFTWRGNGQVSGLRSTTFASWDSRGFGEEWRQSDGGSAAMKNAEVSLWLNRKSVTLHSGGEFVGAGPQTKTGRRGVMRGTGPQAFAPTFEPIDETSPGSILGFYLGSDDKAAARRWQVVQSGPGVHSFAHEESGRTTMGIQTPVESIKRSRVVLFPVYDDVEVEVTIADYAKWRPKGSIADPKKPGNALVAHAVLKSKSGKATVLPEVERFRFELLDTSREPGICLNWPLNAKDDDYDLKLASFASAAATDNVAAARKFLSEWGMTSMGNYDLASLPAGGIPPWSFPEISENGQKGELPNPPQDKAGQPFADAAIESYDFGGKSELRVTCILRDGREIIGLMKGEGGAQDLVRLPKRAGPDWIAEVWRKENDVMNLAASDDSEKVEGQPMNGDGFTLYEEYRGWVVNGQHAEGDPKRKDFFVLNMIGADARAGLELFEQLAQLRVHSKVRRWEMSPETRLMNGNHRDAPHRVDQHGVWVKTFTRAALGDNGADTPMTKAGVAGRPGITKGVGILARGNSESAFNQPYNLPAQDAIFAYDRAIAHELLHAVGVEHHGPDDKTGYALKFIPPNVPENKIGRPHYQTGDGTAITLLQENGHELAAATYVVYAETMARYKSMMMDMLVALWSKGPAGSSDPAEATRLAEASLRGAFDQFFEQRGIVGKEGAAHSGDQDCVMRYYFARFYEAKSRADTLYIVTPGTERIGLEICRAGTGTGINAGSHRPQARYGNAAGGAGNCFAQICPNDAIPPRSVK